MSISGICTFLGEIENLQLEGDEWSRIAYVSFKSPQNADIAILLSGMTVGDIPVTIAAVPEYGLPPSAPSPSNTTGPTPKAATSSSAEKAEDVVKLLIAKGFVLGKDAMSIAKSFAEKCLLTASADLESLGSKTDPSLQLPTDTCTVSGKVTAVEDDKIEVLAEKDVTSLGKPLIQKIDVTSLGNKSEYQF